MGKFNYGFRDPKPSRREPRVRALTAGLSDGVAETRTGCRRVGHPESDDGCYLKRSLGSDDYETGYLDEDD